jgi:hypothetical protein
MQSAAAPNQRPQSPQVKRQLRNFLLLQRFQLKYSAVIVVISSLLCAGLGIVIYQRTQDTFELSKEALIAAQAATDSAKDAVESAKDANDEARAASEMLRLEQLSNPEAAKGAVEASDSKYAEKAKEMELRAAEFKAKAAELKLDADKIAAQRASTVWYLGGLFGILVFALGIFGIVITHRVAGPLFVFGRVFSSICDGNYQIYKRSLRKGDELAEIFQKGVDALQALNDRASADLLVIEKSLALVKKMRESGQDAQALSQIEESLRGLAAQKSKSIGKDYAA